ncbi:MAG: acyltransferase family protein, partial [Bryocella sp.]
MSRDDAQLSKPAWIGQQQMFATTPRFYRPELDVIRFLAFLCVFWHHGTAHTGESFRSDVGWACGFGLCLFFTLSAYLITTLLLRERVKTGSVNLRQFYIRRMLRIWPLYFTALFMGMLIVAHDHGMHIYLPWFIGAFLMLGNVVGVSAYP